ncbi:MAG: InlB B-repeat-containing protein [Oscillospiraceae bacterium]|jgi:uncharacterized repeat protein (TIGR02543 family)|nr:InlB B-repeat-containing protein [Oscillospiraceae bacterium]
MAVYPVSNQAQLASALASAEAVIEIVVEQSFSVTSLVAISGAGKTISITSGAGGPYTLLRGVTGNLFTLSGANSTVTLTNILIDGNKSTAPYAANAGGCLFYVNAAAPSAPNLVVGSGAALQNNHSTSGNAAGVIVASGGWLRLQNGGAVRYNDGGSNGGVYLNGTATVQCRMDINGGSVDHNTGTSVGGIYVLRSQLTMNSGSVAYNNGVNGGGVYVNADATFTMNGGAVEYNTTIGSASVHGGGIDLSAAGALFVMNGGSIQYNSSPYGGGMTLHANTTAVAQINAGSIVGNEATGAGAVGAGILFYNGGTTTVAANVYLGVTPGGVPTAGPVVIANNQALQGTAGGIGATVSTGTLPTADQLLTYYWPHLYVGPNVYFSGNQSSEGRDISGNACTSEDCSGDVDAAMELLCTRFRDLSATRILTTHFTAPFTYGYNDFDIQMPIGCTVAAVLVTFRPAGGEPFTYVVPQGGVVPNPTPVEGCNQYFTFWYADPEHTIPWDFDTEIYSSIDLYGLDAYIPCTYRHVVFFTNGGSAVPTQAVVTGTAAAEPPVPVRGCDRFAGWYTDPALTVPYDFSSPVNGNIILYAKWIPV